METKKEHWIEQTLNSAESIKSQSISESLRKRLESIPAEVVILNSTIPLRSVWLVAASIALLIAINIVSVKQSKQTMQQTNSSIYSEYFSYLDQI